MVREGDFSDADDAVHEDEIALHGAREGLHRQLVGAHEAPGADALLDEPPGFRHEVRRRSGHAVCSEDAHHGGDASPDEGGKSDLGRAGGEPSLAAAAAEMHVAVHETRNGEQVRRVQHLQVRQRAVLRKFLPHPGDALSRQENVPSAQWFRGVDRGVFHEYEHGHSSRLTGAVFHRWGSRYPPHPTDPAPSPQDERTRDCSEGGETDRMRRGSEAPLVRRSVGGKRVLSRSRATR